MGIRLIVGGVGFWNSLARLAFIYIEAVKCFKVGRKHWVKSDDVVEVYGFSQVRTLTNTQLGLEYVRTDVFSPQRVYLDKTSVCDSLIEQQVGNFVVLDGIFRIRCLFPRRIFRWSRGSVDDGAQCRLGS